MKNRVFNRNRYILLAAGMLLLLLCLLPRAGYAVSSGWKATYGNDGCEYQIVDGVLTIRPLNNGASGCLQNELPDNYTVWPWYISRGTITSVVVKPGVKAGGTLYGAFYDCGAQTMDLSNLDTSATTSMEEMFCGCSSLTTLNVSGWNTANVTNMRSMFYRCGALQSLDLSTWDTSKVATTAFMFSSCKSMESLNLTGKWSTASVTDMDCMFSYCEALKTVDTSTWNTSKVANMDSMFDSCKSLESLDVSKWDVSNVTDMYEIFGYCSSLTALDLTGWNPCKVPDMGYMFTGCKSLQSITFSENFSTASVTNMGGMFNDCQSLKSLSLPEAFKPSKVTDMSHMFYNCYALESISLPDTFDTSSVTTMQGMFSGCSALLSLKLPDAFDTSKVSNMTNMFYGCSAMKSLELSANFNTLLITSTSLMFDSCSALESLTLPEAFNTSNVTNMSFMFSNCTKLKKISFPETFNTSKVTDMSCMFSYCSALEGLEFPDAFDTSNVTNMAEMFDGCAKLQSADFLADFDTSKVTNMQSMFSGCTTWTTLSLPSNFDTSNVQDMSYMFYRNTALETLDLSGCNTAKVSSTSGMFWRCSSLKTIYVDSDKWSTASVGKNNSSNMFTGCEKLTGGKNTGYSASHLDAGYARVDYGTTNPGYLSKRALTLSFPGVTGGAVSKAYGDAAFTETASGTDAQITYASSDTTVATVDSAAGTVTILQPGTATITATSGETSTTYAGEGSYTLTVARSGGMTLSCAGYSGTYDGQIHAPVAVPSVTEGTTVTYSVDNGTSYSATEPEIKDVGSITVLAKAENPNYAIAECSYTLTVTARSLSVEGTTVSNKSYDGKTTASVTAGTLQNVVEGEDVSIASVAGTFRDANAGQNKPVDVTYTLTGTCYTGTSNYTLSNPTGLTASISPKAVTQIQVTGIDEEYFATGSTIQPVPTGVTVDGVPVGPDSYDVSYPSQKDYTSIDTGYQVKITLKGNYSGETVTEFAIISGTIIIELTSGSASKVYDGVPLTCEEVTVTSGSVLPGDSFTYTITGSQTDVGIATNGFTYDVYAPSGAEYKVSLAFGTLEVTASPSQDAQVDTDALREVLESWEAEDENSSVSVELRVSKDVAEAQKLLLAAVTENRQAVYYDAKLYTTIDGMEYDIGDSNEIPVTTQYKFNFSGCTDLRVYREHNGVVDELQESPNECGEFVNYDRSAGQVTVTANRYSTFCITWVMETPATGDNSGWILYGGLALLSVIGLIAVVIAGKRRRG